MVIVGETMAITPSHVFKLTTIMVWLVAQFGCNSQSCQILKNKIVIAQPRESVCEKGCIIMLNKKDQVRNLSVKISSTLKDAEIIYDAFCEVIEEGILTEGKVKVGNIATVEVKDVNARTGRDPRTGEPIEIAARKKVAVKIASGLKEKVNAQYIETTNMT